MQQTIVVYVGEGSRELAITKREAKRHALKAGQTIDPGLGAAIARDRVIESGAFVEKVLIRHAQRTSKKVDKNLCGGGYIRRP